LWQPLRLVFSNHPIDHNLIGQGTLKAEPGCSIKFVSVGFAPFVRILTILRRKKFRGVGIESKQLDMVSNDSF
jgi:hypothetical protein